MYEESNPDKLRTNLNGRLKSLHDLYEADLFQADLSLSDLAADVQAPTPSAAAEIVSANRLELQQRVGRMKVNLESMLVQYQFVLHQLVQKKVIHLQFWNYQYKEFRRLVEKFQYQSNYCLLD